jgi:hypothetical protein
LDYDLSASNQEASSQYDSPSTQHRQLLGYIENLPTANYFTACLIDPVSGQCLNNHNTFNSIAKSLTLANSTVATTPPQLLISIPTLGAQSASLKLSNMSLTTYKPLVQSVVNLDLRYPKAQLTSSIEKILLPKSLSVESYYFNPMIDSLRTYNEACKDGKGYRTTKQLLPHPL